MCQSSSCMLTGFVSAPWKKYVTKQQCEQCKIWVRCWADIHAFWICCCSCNKFRKQALVCLNWNWRHEVSSLLAHHCTLLLFWNVAMPQTHLRRPILRPLGGGKDNEFLCQVEEGDSSCFQKNNRQHQHGAGDRGQSSLKGQICYRE